MEKRQYKQLLAIFTIGMTVSWLLHLWDKAFFEAVMIVAFLCLLFLVLFSNFRKSAVFWSHLLCMFSGFFAVYVCFDVFGIHPLQPTLVCQPSWSRRYVASNIFILYAILLAAGLCNIHDEVAKNKQQHRDDINERNRKLFPEQREDLNHIIDAISASPIIGVEGVWGNGKTFVMQALKDTLNEQGQKFEVVEIDILAMTVENVWSYLIKELDGILYKNGILSLYSYRLRQFFLRPTLLGTIGDLFGFSSYAYLDVFYGTKHDLKKTEKDIIIIYEDIDRITDTELIRKVFYISEKLSGNNVKIIYQYEFNHFIEIGFSHSYLNKYIPLRIPLTTIPFYTLIQRLMNQDD